jgi:hypothetical protein
MPNHNAVRRTFLAQDVTVFVGVIHTIDQCLMYGYTQMNAETGLGGVQ